MTRLIPPTAAKRINLRRGELNDRVATTDGSPPGGEES
jgi:hypothetical protein